MKEIWVKVSGTYRILIGRDLLDEAGPEVRALGGVRSVMIVSDDRVFPLYGGRVVRSLESCGFRTFSYVFPNGEERKNLTVYGAILNELAEAGFTRSDLIVALGGGVVGDLAGFVAATFLRGIRFVQIPTTLLAAVDSSVSGKTAVDLPAGKNLAGAFHQPSLVLADTDTFSTLPKEQYLAGAAETLKYGVIGSKAWFDRWSETPIDRIYEETVEAAVTMKRDLVEKDEFDWGDRMLLNFGHTFGHAAEACSGYSLLHGFAVAMGMAVVTRASEAFGIAEKGTAETLESVLKAYDLPTGIPYGKEELLPHVFLDKKARGDSVNLIVPERIGHCRVLPVRKEEAAEWLDRGGVR